VAPRKKRRWQQKKGCRRRSHLVVHFVVQFWRCRSEAWRWREEGRFGGVWKRRKKRRDCIVLVEGRREEKKVKGALGVFSFDCWGLGVGCRGRCLCLCLLM